MWQRLLNYAQLMRLHRPIGIWLLLWPTLWALWIAGQGKPSIKNLIIFILSAIVMRSAGCVINDFADRHFDGHVERTRQRPLVTGKVTAREAIGLFGFLILIGFILVLQLNVFTIKLSLVAVLLATIYPFTKRFLSFPQVILGLAFAWAVPMAFAAELNAIPAIAWLIYLIAVLWPLAYDTMYAITDREDDLKIGIKSTAILFGHHDQLIIGTLQLVIFILLVLVGVIEKLNFYYYLCLLAAAGFFIYQQFLLSKKNPVLGLKAFLNNNWFGMIVFIGFFLGYLK